MHNTELVNCQQRGVSLSKIECEPGNLLNEPASSSCVFPLCVSIAQVSFNLKSISAINS